MRFQIQDPKVKTESPFISAGSAEKKKIDKEIYETVQGIFIMVAVVGFNLLVVGGILRGLEGARVQFISLRLLIAGSVAFVTAVISSVVLFCRCDPIFYSEKT